MQYKALVSRTILMADESIRVNIANGNKGLFSWLDISNKITEAFAHTDARAYIQAQRLLEDSDLVQNLTADEYASLAQCMEYLYPKPEITVSCFDKTVQIELSKLNGSGESLTVQLHNITPTDNVELAISNTFDLLDARLAATNAREIAHMEFMRTLDYQTKLKITMIMDILYGRNQNRQEVASRLATPEATNGTVEH